MAVVDRSEPTARPPSVIREKRYYKSKPQKKRPPVAAAPAQPAVEEPEPEVILKGFRYDGMVRRSGGPSTAWVDGRPVLVGAPTEQGLEFGLSRDGRGDLQVQLPRDGEDVSLKPGQVFDPGTGGIPYTGRQDDGGTP